MTNSRGYVRKYISPEPHSVNMDQRNTSPANITAIIMTITPSETLVDKEFVQ